MGNRSTEVIENLYRSRRLSFKEYLKSLGLKWYQIDTIMDYAKKEGKKNNEAD